jgi:methionyl-tRNA formyltransferase
MNPRMLTITILVDNPQSWFVPFGKEFAERLAARGHRVHFTHNQQEIVQGDITFFMSCENIVGMELRRRSRNNIVVHASALPAGKGWSPTTWQILEGKSEIPITLFEATDEIDAGPIYASTTVKFDGHELIDEIRSKEGNAIIDLTLSYVDNYPMNGTPQNGESTFYVRRSPNDSAIDPNKSIIEQFNLLRVVDNERYPAFFRYNGHTYVLKIYKQTE